MEEADRITGQDRKSAIGSMFDDIAGRYDFLNHLLSFGMDRSWRTKAIRTVSGRYENPQILDVATGTGDLAIAAMKLNPCHVTGIDISEKMLEEGRMKINNRGLSDRIELIHGDSENIPFGDHTYDLAMVAFGVRNFSDWLKGLSEINRVLKKRGMIMVMEFSRPANLLFKQVYLFYFTRLLPIIGRIFSKNRTAYSYLPESVMQFPDNDLFVTLMTNAGFSDISQKKLTGGVATIYVGIKANEQ